MSIVEQVVPSWLGERLERVTDSEMAYYLLAMAVDLADETLTEDERLLRAAADLWEDRAVEEVDPDRFYKGVGGLFSADVALRYRGTDLQIPRGDWVIVTTDTIVQRPTED